MNTFQRIRHETRDFAWALCGNVVYSACQWSFVIVLAKTGTTEDVGLYALAVAISAPLLTFANCQGRNLVASDIDNAHTFGEYMRFRFISLLLAIAAVLAIAFRAQHASSAAAVTCLLAVSQSFDWLSETCYGLMQKHDRLDRVGQSMILKGLLCLALLSGAMYLTHNLLWAAVGLMTARASVLAIFDMRIAWRTGEWIREKWDWVRLLPQLKSALPLGLISSIAAFNVSIPRYFIESHMQTRDLGIYSAAASLVGIGNLVMSALANSSFVGLARAVAAADYPVYRRLSLRLFLTAAGLGLLGVLASKLAGREILSRLFRPEYGAGSGILMRLMIAGGITYVISGQGYALTAARVLLPQIPILCCAALTTAGFCQWLVPLHGLAGAAEASVLSAAVTLGLSSIILARFQSAGRGASKPGVIGGVSSEAA